MSNKVNIVVEGNYARQTLFQIGIKTKVPYIHKELSIDTPPLVVDLIKR